MSYSDFTPREVSRKFGLTIDHQHLFDEAPELEASPALLAILDDYDSLARAINTEKARSEFLIAPVLAEVRRRHNKRISLFSGVDFPAAPDQGLNGVCDFLLSRSPQQEFVLAPVVAVVEAKNGNLKTGLGQCIASMVGARVFNEREGEAISTIYGVITTGTLWQFLRLDGPVVSLDQRELQIERLPKILGILSNMIEPADACAGTNLPGDLGGPR